MTDPYVYQNGVLINKLGITDAKKLEAAERVLAGARWQTLPKDLPLSAEGLSMAHKHLFEQVYPWAGEFRTISIRKVVGNDLVNFTPGPFVRPRLKRYFLELTSDNYLKDRPLETFAYQASVYLADLNDLHPFREGNGRTQRIFLQRLGENAGHKLDMAKLDPKRWIAATQDSASQQLLGPHHKMTSLIKELAGAPRLPDPCDQALTQSGGKRRPIRRRR